VLNGGFPSHMTYNEGMLASNVLDSVLKVADETLRTLFAPAQGVRQPPLPPDAALTEAEKRHAAGLMRVNHAGEIAAQGLYRGQAALSRSGATRDFMRRAASEEGDHLAWCESRLHELDSRPSRLNPIWYLGSFAIGAAAAALGDEHTRGLVTETEPSGPPAGQRPAQSPHRRADEIRRSGACAGRSRPRRGVPARTDPDADAGSRARHDRYRLLDLSAPLTHVRSTVSCGRHNLVIKSRLQP
jgi:hypothetical protein